MRKLGAGSASLPAAAPLVTIKCAAWTRCNCPLHLLSQTCRQTGGVWLELQPHQPLSLHHRRQCTHPRCALS